MNQDALINAIKLAQLTKITTPPSFYRKSLSKAVSRIRSRLEGLMSLAATHCDEAIVRRAETAIDQLYLDVKKCFLAHFNAVAIIDFHLGTQKSAFSAFKTTPAKGKLIEADFSRVLESSAFAMPPAKDEKDANARREAIHLFSSVVRNSSWMPLLKDLAIDLPYSALSVRSNALLCKHCSQEGLARAGERMNALLGSAKPTGTKTRKTTRKTALKLSAAGLYQTQVVVDATAVLSRPDVSAIFATCAGLDDDKTLERLVERLVQPILLAPEDNAEARVQERLDEFCAVLTLHQKKIEDEQKKRQKERIAKQEQAAVEALKQLDPKLLRLLRDNPDLLKSV